MRTPYQTTDTTNEAEQYDCDDDDLGHVIAAIDMKDYGTVGCAYYSAEEEKLYLLGDSRSGGMEAIDALILQIKPTIILTPSRVEIPSARGREQSLAQDNVTSSYLPYQVDVRPTQEFSFSNAQNSLVALDMSSSHEERIRFFVPSTGIDGPEEISAEDMGFSLREGRLLHISSSVDMENPVSIGCAGAVLTRLQRRRATATSIGPLDDCPFRVRYLEMFNLRDSM
ncbi:hypothetical protein PoHVEF18_002040 [Penicillium ochrochloron]